jgi:large subunit ribosomal protein L16
MLMPKRMKFRKAFRGSMKGPSKGGNTLSFGECGLKALSCGWITARQIEASRRALTRHTARGGRVWIRIFPHKPVSKKPIETRMGGGKGAIEEYVAVIKPGRVLFEIGGIPRKLAKEAMVLAAAKLPIRTHVIEKSLTQ